jgi:hypothetical protein
MPMPSSAFGWMTAARRGDVSDAAPVGHSASMVIEIGAWRPAMWRALRLFAETVLMPTLILAVLLHVVGLVVALAAALGWCYSTLAARWILGHRLPGTMFVCAGMMSGRAAIALATSSAFVYLLQPVLGSVCMALLFLGSAAFGRPVTMRLARDFVSIPAHIINRRGVRRMFTQVALFWGVSRLADAGMSLGFLRLGVNAGLLSRGVFSPVLTLATVALCTCWGWRALHRDGIKLRVGRAAIA